MMRALALTSVVTCALAACTPAPPPAPTEPVRNVHFRVSTMPSVLDKRFFVEFQSLSRRTLCLSANDWPTAQGELGANRAASDGDEVRRVERGDTLTAFVNFDQFPPASVEGDAVHQVDIVPQPFFCTAEQ